jgi:hypothetical protein
MIKAIHILSKPALVLLFMAGTAFGTCINPITAKPSSINFGESGVGLGLYNTELFTLTNRCTQTVTVNSLTFSSSVFGLADGVLPRYVAGNSSDNWSIAFRPTAAQVYSGTLTVDLAGFPPVTITLKGTGVVNTGLASLSTNSVNFGNVAIGSAASKNITLTNNGSDTFELVQLETYAPFQAPPVINAVTLAPGQTYKFGISYTATSLGAVTGAVTLVYNQLPAQGIDITATGVAATGVALSSFPVLPSATQNSPYLATLQATGGIPPYTFHATRGLIPGLTFTPSTGTFEGTIASSVAVGSYSITVQIDDSSKPQRQANATVTIPVGPLTGANCSVIDFDAPGTSTPLTALNDLGTGIYGTGCPEPEGCEGGLYPQGSNIDPGPHASDGISIGQGIQPRDADGNIDAENGTIVFMSLGVSNTQQPFIDFMNSANGDPLRNPRVAIVNGALGGETADKLASPTAGYLATVVNYILPLYGYTAQQVAAVWLDTVDSGDNSGFPSDAKTIQSYLETIATDVKTDFPNLVTVYLGPLNYTGYSEGISTILPEPQAYDSAWGDKWAIEDQINGTCCNYNPASGTVVAPWMAWGPYYWANGLLAREDGTSWSCQDLNADGTHPAYPGGHLKIADALLNFLKTDPTATPWFLAPGALARHK